MDENTDESVLFHPSRALEPNRERLSGCGGFHTASTRLDSTRPDPSEENPDECRWISYPDRLDSFRGKRHDPVRSLQTDPEYTNTIDVLIIVPARAMQQMGVEMRCCYSSGAERSNRHAIG